MIRKFLGACPECDPTSFIAPSAEVIGDVRVGAESSIWFNSTVRGDVNWIRIGSRTNIQDNCVVHVTRGSAPARIGDGVTVGHGAVIHGCTIEDYVLVGMGSVILDGAVVGSHSIIGAKALVTQNMRIPPRSMVFGAPARVVRELSEEEVTRILRYAENYVRYKRLYRGEEKPTENPFYDPRLDEL